jgi:hypothetical protein
VSPETRSRRREPDDATTRIEANRAVATATLNLDMIGYGLIGAAILGGFVLAVTLLGGADPLVTAASSAVFAASVIGCVRIRREPVLWTSVNAVLGTPMGVIGALAVLQGKPPGAINGAIMALLSGAYWVAVPMAARVQGIVRAYPDLYAARALRGEGAGRHAQEARAETARRRRRAFAITACVAAGLGVLILLGGRRGAAAPWTAPVAFEATEARWRTAWNADDVPAVKAFVAASERRTREPFLDRQIAKRSWTPLPQLAAPQIREHAATQRSAAYDVADRELDLTIFWEWESSDWVVVNWEFPNR